MVLQIIVETIKKVCELLFQGHSPFFFSSPAPSFFLLPSVAFFAVLEVLSWPTERYFIASASALESTSFLGAEGSSSLLTSREDIALAALRSVHFRVVVSCRKGWWGGGGVCTFCAGGEGVGRVDALLDGWGLGVFCHCDCTI